MMWWLMMQAALAAPCHAVVDASVVLPSGLAEHHDVVWSDGRISALGPTGAGIAEGCTRHDAAVVTASFVAVGQPLGLVEIELEATTRDDRFARPDPVTPAVEVADGYDPASAVIPLTRQGGVATALIRPTGGLVSGTAAVVSLTRARQDDAIVTRQAGLVVDLDDVGSVAAGAAHLRALVGEARAWAAAGRPAVWPGATRSTGALAATIEAVGLRPEACEAQGPIQVWADADRAADLSLWVRLSTELGVCIGVLGGAEAWQVADDLASVNALVVVDPTVYGAGSMDQRGGVPDNARRLHEEGVDLAFLPPDAHRARSLRHVAGNAVREGLPWNAAIDALTVVPARRLGLEARRLEVGAPAHLALWTGDPLDTPSTLHALIHAGEPVDTTSRHDLLVERYRTLPRQPFPDPDAVD